MDIETNVEVAAPPETVWPYLVDWERLGLWMEEASNFRVITSQREGVGVEARATVRFLEELHDEVALFILGEFDLTPGSIVAQRPAEFGLRETFRVEGDELGIGLFYEEARPPKSARELEALDDAIGRLSEGWLLRRYPWAGSLSTAHTILWYDRFGPDAFRRLRGRRAAVAASERHARARFDVAAVSAASAAAEMAIWHTLVRERRAVSRAAYRALADAQPAALPAAPARRWRYGLGETPRVEGRRGQHGVNRAVVKRPGW